jgi:hypothetical protein
MHEGHPLMAADVALACHHQLHAESIELGYQLDNRGAADVLVMNRVMSQAIDGTAELLPETVYVDLQGGVLELIKACIPIPSGHFPSIWPIPYASLLRAGGRLSERFVLPLPARVRHPGRVLQLSRVAATKAASARKLRFSVSFVLPDGEPRTTYPGYPGTFVPPSNLALTPDQQTLLSQTFDLEREVPVLDYQVFPRPDER